MRSVTVKTLAALALAGGSVAGLAPAQALPGLDRGVVTGSAPMVEKTWCGPYGCGPRWGGYGYGYGWRPQPRPWSYGYGYGYGYGARPWGGGWGYRGAYWGGSGWGGGGWGRREWDD